MTTADPNGTPARIGWLSAIGWMVPSADRPAWLLEWEAEVVFHDRSRASSSGAVGRPAAGVVVAAIQHALWLRWQSLRVETIAQDVRLAVRTLVRRPAFSLAAIATLAIGIGGTTLIFCAMRAVFWRPLPYPHAEHLVMLSSATAAAPAQAGANSVSPPDFADWERDSRTVEGVAAIRDDGFVLTIGDEAEQISGNAVTGRFFGALGVPAAVGRAFVNDDANPGMPDVAVLADSLWRRRFGGSREAIGKSIVLDGMAREIVGVMPAAFDYPLGADVWVPLRFSPADLTTQRGAHYLTVIGRLRPEVALSTARTEMAGVAGRAASAYPRTNKDARISVVPLRQAIVGEEAPAAMRLVFSAVAGLLLIACVNVASLLLGQALGRSRDVAVRVALGASRARIMRTLLVESAVIALAGGLAGLALAAVGARSIAALTAVSIPWLDQTRLDPAVLVFAGALTMASTCLFGLVPAWQASRRAASRDLGSTRVSEDRSRTRLRSALVVAEISLAAALFVGAGLLARSFLALSRVNPGVDVAGVQTASVSLPDGSYKAVERRSAFVDDVLTRIRVRPDVEAAGAVFGLPLTDFNYFILVYERDGLLIDQGNRIRLQVRVATPDYFKAVGIPVVNGRVFDDTDRRGGPPVAVLSESAARQLWPGADPRGHRVLLSTRMSLGPDRLGGEVIGTVGDVRQNGPADPPAPTIYVSHAQFPTGFVAFVVKSHAEPSDLVSFIRASVATVDPRVPLFRVRTLEDLASRAVAQPRLFLVLLGLFASAAVSLAAVGIYGVMAQNVGARRREMAVRLALGATPRELVSLVVGHAGRLALVGVTGGLLLAALLRSALTSLLFGVGALDAMTYAAVGVATLVVAAVAAWLPARRAATIDPLATLRTD